jgi:hypothetical protein
MVCYLRQVAGPASTGARPAAPPGARCIVDLPILAHAEDTAFKDRRRRCPVSTVASATTTMPAATAMPAEAAVLTSAAMRGEAAMLAESPVPVRKAVAPPTMIPVVIMISVMTPATDPAIAVYVIAIAIIIRCVTNGPGRQSGLRPVPVPPADERAALCPHGDDCGAPNSNHCVPPASPSVVKKFLTLLPFGTSMRRVRSLL